MVTPMSPDQRIIVALDVADLESAEKLLAELKGVISYYKVGLELFSAYGWKALELVRKYGGKIFLDLKLHDIPTTVAKTASVICDHDVDMFNVHTLGGYEMMQKTADAVFERCAAKKNKPLLIGVTILTSHSPSALSSELGISRSLEEEVLGLAGLARKAGLNGVVCSPQEIRLMRESFGKDFVIVTPGIRPVDGTLNDQKRVLTPGDALRAGSDYLVIGRPITGAPKPRAAAEAIIASLLDR